MALNGASPGVSFARETITAGPASGVTAQVLLAATSLTETCSDGNLFCGTAWHFVSSFPSHTSAPESSIPASFGNHTVRRPRRAWLSPNCDMRNTEASTRVGLVAARNEHPLKIIKICQLLLPETSENPWVCKFQCSLFVL